MSFVRCKNTTARRGRWLAATLCFSYGFFAFAEKPPVPNLRLPLTELGFPGYPVALMHAGASMATIHMLDNTHALFTFSLRSLVPRLVGDDENDTDRLVAGEIVELPTGKVLARTEWHLHDHGRYLWSAGQGLFVLRSGQELSLFAPLRGLASGTSFQRIALPHRSGLPELIESSPDGRILTVQMQHPEEQASQPAEGDEQPRRKRTTIEFYRISTQEAERPVELKPAGVVGAPGFLRLSLDGDGYLWAEENGRNQWAVTFNEYEGKPQPLSTVRSSCAPTLRLLSRSQFAALSCTSMGGPQLTVFGFDGHENWEEPFGETLQAPNFVMAPEAGRFALGRFYASGTGSGQAGDSPLGEEVRIYQTESGSLLLHVLCDPVARTGENFDLASDGRTLVVLGSKSLDLYTLPALSAQDHKDLAEVEGMRPPEAHGPVTLRRITRPIRAGDAEAEETVHEEGESAIPDAGGDSAAPSNAAPASVSAAATTGISKQGSRTAAAADTGAVPAADESRKAPTLLNPGETPEFKQPRSSPQ